MSRKNNDEWCYEQRSVRICDFLHRLPRHEVYRRMKAAGIIDGYVVPGYDVLHTYSRSYIVDDITDFMKAKGVLK